MNPAKKQARAAVEQSETPTRELTLEQAVSIAILLLG
jgi:hypothetical protein